MMQRKGIAWRYVLWKRRIPGDDLRRADKIQPGRCQHWHVQCLTDMAGRIGTICVLVKERSARGKIEQRGTSQQRQTPAHSGSSEQDSHRIHHTEIYLSTTDG